jgi:hypothetical protein
MKAIVQWQERVAPEGKVVSEDVVDFVAALAV